VPEPDAEKYAYAMPAAASTPNVLRTVSLLRVMRRIKSLLT
jgi:hypothetical protein